jgi:hypothetical protein
MYLFKNILRKKQKHKLVKTDDYPVKNNYKKTGIERIHKNMETCLSCKERGLQFNERVHERKETF